MTSLATMPVNILAFDESLVQTTCWQLQQWKSALKLEEKGLTMSRGRKVSTHLRKLLRTPARYPIEALRGHVERSIDSIHEQLGVGTDESD